MSKSIEQISKEELGSLTEFARRLTVKEQEIADEAEYEALARANIGFIPYNRPVRSWKQVVGYIAPGSTTVETNRPNNWYYRGPDSEPADYAVDDTYGLWFFKDGMWQSVTVVGRVRPDMGEGWTHISAPRGESYVDPVRAICLATRLVWLDQTTGETSVIGPGSGEFVGELPTPGAHPPGLSDLISTSQEYVTAKLRLATAELSPSERAGLIAAIESFETPGLWEDVRQPFFAVGSDGGLVLDGNGYPVPNPLRVVEVAYRGELNDYYRRLVRDSGVSPITSRTAEQFEVIAWDDTAGGLTANEVKRFVTMHTESVRVFKAAFYNEALEGDPLYFRYCRLFIAWMTVMRSVSERMGGFQDVELMSDYDLSNLLYSFGIYQFDDLPVNYKRRFAKSLEHMLGEKGTTTVLKDILALFNFDKVMKIWRYYLVRYFPENETLVSFPRLPGPTERAEIVLGSGARVAGLTLAELSAALVSTGKFRLATVSGTTLRCLNAAVGTGRIASAVIVLRGTGTTVKLADVVKGNPDYALPEIGFQKVDIDDTTTSTIMATLDLSKLSDYGEVVGSDPTWKTTREEARKMAFSVLQTKYFSIRSGLEGVYNGMALSMLWSTLKDIQVRGRETETKLTGVYNDGGTLPPLTFFEAMVSALTLTLWKFGVEDIIPHGEGGVSEIIAARSDGVPFPNEGSMLPYSTVTSRWPPVAIPLKKLERAAERAALSPQIVADIVDANSGIASSIEEELVQNLRYGADRSPLYGGEETHTVARDEILRRMWDHKFVGNLQTQAFGAIGTYSGWLDQYNPALGQWVKDIDAAGNHSEGILALVSLIEDKIESGTLQLQSSLGVDDIVILYIERMIRFFKAYTTDLREFSTFMLMDRPATETLRLMNYLLKTDVVVDETSPASPLRDELLPRTVYPRNDALTVATAKQRAGDVLIAAGTVDRNETFNTYNLRRQVSAVQGLADGMIVFVST